VKKEIMKNQEMQNALIDPKLKSQRTKRLKELLTTVDSDVTNIKMYLIKVYGALSEIKQSELYLSVGHKSFISFVRETSVWEKVGVASPVQLGAKLCAYEQAISSGVTLPTIKKIGLSKTYTVYQSGAKGKDFARLCGSSNHEIEKFRHNRRLPTTGRFVKETFNQRPHTKILTLDIEVPKKIINTTYEAELVRFLNKIDARPV